MTIKGIRIGWGIISIVIVFVFVCWKNESQETGKNRSAALLIH
jgi:hypothetical protein